MNLQEAIKKVLKEEQEINTLIRKIIRRIDLDDAVDTLTRWSLIYYKFKLKEKGVKWFIDTVIYNVYIDVISPIFEEWDEHYDDPFLTISKKQEDQIQEFLVNRYSDFITKKYNEEVGEEYISFMKSNNITEAINTDYAVIEILKPSSRMPSKWYFQAVPVNKTKEDKIYIKRGPSGILTISTKNIKIHKIFKKSEKEEMDKYLEKLRDEDTKKRVNESVNHWFKRRFDIDELNDLVKDVKDQIEEGESLDTAIYDTVRQFIATKRFNDIDNTGTEQQYWDSYLVYEKPLVKYVKEKLKSGKKEMKEGELTEKCWKGYTQKGMKTMFGKRYPNCVKKTK